ncbi:Calcium/calmodulin-dependent protein kinase type 1D [Porphyridium purpureum]|uniref:Calcium/calmodulin-dependent protein kinase type 1D n=1 Tax=Porphyridium purpureum TaxID=35688 RepID=A0A5J4YLM8_PORPP|nr:Calcium/calmodulin-dependent protein kinase type 1D [Porphyridium purpureum]|eukprot:POR3464..scf244_11
MDRRAVPDTAPLLERLDRICELAEALKLRARACADEGFDRSVEAEVEACELALARLAERLQHASVRSESGQNVERCDRGHDQTIGSQQLQSLGAGLHATERSLSCPPWAEQATDSCLGSNEDPHELLGCKPNQLHLSFGTEIMTLLNEDLTPRTMQHASFGAGQFDISLLAKEFEQTAASGSAFASAPAPAPGGEDVQVNSVRERKDKHQQEDPHHVTPSVKTVAGHLYKAGHVSERWTRDRFIARGGFACVYVAVANEKNPMLTPGQVAAMKVFEKDARLDGEILLREIMSCRVLSASGNHPNICTVYEVSEDETSVYLVMEYLCGGELFDRIVQFPDKYTERVCAHAVRQMVDAVLFCHSRNIVHRDLKPENFVFASEADDDALKLIDFGISHFSEFPDEPLTDIVGTPFYLAPEVLFKCPYTSKVDCWALGVITFTMLSGRLPFDYDPDAAPTRVVPDHVWIPKLFNLIKYSAVEMNDPSWVLISDAGKDFVSGLLEKDPLKRMSTAQAKRHPWLQIGIDAASQQNQLSDHRYDLSVAQSHIRSFVARTRWRALFQAVQAGNRLKSLSHSTSLKAEFKDSRRGQSEDFISTGSTLLAGETEPLRKSSPIVAKGQVHWPSSTSAAQEERRMTDTTKNKSRIPADVQDRSEPSKSEHLDQGEQRKTDSKSTDDRPPLASKDLYEAAKSEGSKPRIPAPVLTTSSDDEASGTQPPRHMKRLQKFLKSFLSPTAGSAANSPIQRSREASDVVQENGQDFSTEHRARSVSTIFGGAPGTSREPSHRVSARDSKDSELRSFSSVEEAMRGSFHNSIHSLKERVQGRTKK